MAVSFPYCAPSFCMLFQGCLRVHPEERSYDDTSISNHQVDQLSSIIRWSLLLNQQSEHNNERTQIISTQLTNALLLDKSHHNLMDASSFAEKNSDTEMLISGTCTVARTQEDLPLLVIASNDNDDNNLHTTATSKNESFCVFKGIPSRRPLVRELALRMLLMQERQQPRKQPFLLSFAIFPRKKQRRNTNPSKPSAIIRQRPLLPAQDLGLTEHDPCPFLPPLPPSLLQNRNRAQVKDWLQKAGDRGILEILGMRHTQGSVVDIVLPPPPSILLHAAQQPWKPHAQLTVAGRARAKHAHRTSTSSTPFFGIVRGSPECQNAAALEIVSKLLQEAVWINIHVFGGTTETPVLEVREKHGYGARWVATDWTTSPPADLEFRGFLEPQMPDGHEKKWRH